MNDSSEQGALAVLALVAEGQQYAASGQFLAAENRFRDAFEVLVCGHQDRVVGFCRHMLSDPGIAEDVAQEVFLAVWLGMPNFRHEASLRTWIFAIARNKCLDARRRMARDTDSRRQIEVELERNPGTLKAEKTPAARDMSATLERLLRQLPDADRQILVLTYIVELEPAELVTVLGIAPASVRGRRRRALQRLRELMNQDAK